MGIINRLDNNLINQIAAGEVIERPASVVKELLENSLDAHSTKITVEIKESGFTLIKITDNGNGMGKEDAKLCIERHATSKIKNADDLFKINTLGFRGEALASIASVSNLTLTTKQKEAREAYQISVEAGRIYNEKELGHPDGTKIEIKDLFFNVPARKKFLKNLRIEFQHIVDVVSRYALIHPHVFFKLVHNSKDIFVAPTTSDWQGSIMNIYGKDIAKQLLPVNFSDGDYEIMGFVSKPELTRADKGHQSIYVNKRYIKNPIISSAIYGAYGTLLFNHRHPIVILNINVNPALIDVNVHPTKREIRIDKEEEMKEAVLFAVKEALDKDILIPKDTDVQKRIFIDDIKFDRARFKKKEYRVEPSTQGELPEFAKEEINTSQENPSTDDSKIRPDFTNYQSAYIRKQEELSKEIPKEELRILGQVHNCYIVAEDHDGILLIDQHAAEERVNYEKFMDMYSGKKLDTQNLLDPIHFELNPKDAIFLENNITKFKNIGFDLDNFGHNSFILRTLPIMLGKLQNKQAILDLIDDIKSLRTVEEESIIQKACKASIKQGDQLTHSQMKQLVEKLKQAKVPYTCPHGRPTMIQMTKHELERKFKRTG